jgi:hypothetical protein
MFVLLTEVLDLVRLAHGDAATVAIVLLGLVVAHCTAPSLCGFSDKRAIRDGSVSALSAQKSLQ